MTYFRNSLWMISEQGLKLISGLLVGIYVARYLQPEAFGILSYGIAIVSVLLAITRIGMESILVRDISKTPADAPTLVLFAFTLMSFASLVAFLFLTAMMFLTESDPRIRTYVLLLGVALLVQPTHVVDYYFQAMVRARQSSILKSAAIVLGSVIKIALVLSRSDLSYFVLAYAFDYFLVAALFIVAFPRSFLARLKHTPRLDFRPLRPLLRSAMPMALSTASAMLFMRADQIMIKHMLGLSALGQYSAATRIYEGWIVLPAVVSLSVIPWLTQAKVKSLQSYEAGLERLFFFLFWIGVSSTLIVFFFGKPFVLWSFGENYALTPRILTILMSTACFNSIGILSGKYLVIEGMEKKIVQRTFVALVLNIALNLIFIPQFGLVGAAFATLLSLSFSNYAWNYLDRDLHKLLAIENRAIAGHALRGDVRRRFAKSHV